MKKLNNILEGMFDIDDMIDGAQKEFLMSDLKWIKDSTLRSIIGNITPSKSSYNYDTIFTQNKGLKGTDLKEFYNIYQNILYNSSLSEVVKNKIIDELEDELMDLYAKFSYIRMLEAAYIPITEIDKILKTHKHLKILKKAWIIFLSPKDYSKVELTISVFADQEEEWKKLLDESGIEFKLDDGGFSIICPMKDPLIQTIHETYKSLYL